MYLNLLSPSYFVHSIYLTLILSFFSPFLAFFWIAFIFFLSPLYLFILKNLFIYLLFIFGCVGSSLLLTGFLSLWQVAATLHCSARASHCSGFSCYRAQALGVRASVVVAHGTQ